MTDLEEEPMPFLTRPNAEIEVSLDLLRMILDLPEDYRIVAGFTSHVDMRRTVTLQIEAKSLPSIGFAGRRHLVTPIYRAVNTGKAERSELIVVMGHDRG